MEKHRHQRLQAPSISQVNIREAIRILIPEVQDAGIQPEFMEVIYSIPYCIISPPHHLVSWMEDLV